MKPIAHMDAHELDAIAGEYVLGTLSPADRTAVQQALGKTPLLAAAVARWEERLLPLTGLVRPIELRTLVKLATNNASKLAGDNASTCPLQKELQAES